MKLNPEQLTLKGVKQFIYYVDREKKNEAILEMPFSVISRVHDAFIERFMGRAQEYIFSWKLMAFLVMRTSIFLAKKRMKERVTGGTIQCNFHGNCHKLLGQHKPG